jgi:hypothetical protein
LEQQRNVISIKALLFFRANSVSNVALHRALRHVHCCVSGLSSDIISTSSIYQTKTFFFASRSSARFFFASAFSFATLTALRFSTSSSSAS